MYKEIEMADESEILLKNSLTAEELLRNKGIRSVVWDKYEKSYDVLPKTGKKQFEPNGSWLQNMQIDKNLQNCKELIGIERVERISQLAIAEWLPLQKEARVKKRSSQDWSSFGVERNGVLYLIPEEALFLLEANCLELVWNDVPLSIQQAYELLIDNAQCTLEEYRVYSQLTKYGYHIQRFIYEQSDKIFREETTRRKVIIDPENGLRLSDNQSSQSLKTTDSEPKAKEDINIIDSDTKIYQETTVEGSINNIVSTVIEDLLKAVQSIEQQTTKDVSTDNTVDPRKLPEDAQSTQTTTDKKRNLKVEIISDETLVGNNIRVVNGMNSEPRWRGSRIQRNVKLLPKRTDKPSIHDVSIIDSNSKTSERSSEKRHAPATLQDESQSKKVKQEVIELSDDEIQEIPRPMTRTELLNLLPNIASQSTITLKISRGYIPHNVKPQKNVYKYDNKKLRNLYDADMKLREKLKPFTEKSNQSQQKCDRNLPVVNMPDIFLSEFYSPQQRRHFANFGSPFAYDDAYSMPYNQNTYYQNRNAMLQRNMFENILIALQNHGNAIQHNRLLSIQINNFMISNIANIRNPFVRNQIRPAFHQNFSPRNFFQQRVVENMSFQCNTARNMAYAKPRQRRPSRDSNNTAPSTSSRNTDEVYHPSFKVLPGTSSWAELKTKWREERTITIDDEDSNREENNDCNEIEVVGQYTSPLVNPKNVTCLADVFERLRIIKSAPEKAVRRKKTRYKISYNVYPSGQHYKKANPGTPVYRVVVIRQRGDPFLQSIELQRLQQDAKDAPIMLACVSMSISYIQAGFVSLPNLT